MSINRFFAILTAALPLWAGALAVPENAILFAEPKLDAQRVGMVPATVEIPVAGHKTVLAARHPLARYYDFYRFEPEPGKTAWVCPRVVFERESPTGPRLTTAPRDLDGRTVWFLLTAAALTLWGWWGVHRRKMRQPGAERFWFAALGLVLIRQFLLFYCVVAGDNIITSPADDPGYFETMRDLLGGRWRNPWNFTIGTGFWYLPFLWWTGAENFTDIAVPVSYFFGFFIAPLSLALGCRIVQKLTGSLRIAFAAMLLWALWPFWYFHLPDWDAVAFHGYFEWLPTGFNYRYYTTVIGAGFNAMSDTPSTFLVLGALLMALSTRRFRGYFACLGALFGFACLVRINNILFAPLLGFAVWSGLAPEERGSWRWLTGTAAWSAVGFFAVFGWQLLFNWVQNGGPLTFGYIRHYASGWSGPRPHNGFTWEIFRQGRHVQFLTDCNRALMAFGFAGLVLLRDRRMRTLLGWWILPVLVFFYGYSHTFCDPVRFILTAFPALFAAGLTASAGIAARSRRSWVPAGLMLCLPLLTLPFWQWGNFPAQWENELGSASGWLNPAGLCLYLAAGVWLWREAGWRALWFPGIFAALYLLIPAWGFAALAGILLVRTVFDTGKSIFLQKKSPETLAK